MSATLAELRAGLAARAATISGVHASAYMLSKPEPPAVCVLPATPDTPATFGGGEDIAFDLWVYAGPTADLVEAQKIMDVFMSPTGAGSLKAAIEAAPGLGLSGVYADVRGWTEYGRLVDVSGVQLFAAPMRVVVRI